MEDRPTTPSPSIQLARFRTIAELVTARGLGPVTRHTACTAAALTLPESLFDLLRLGIGAYGLWPSRETLVSTRAHSTLELKPVLSWKTRVTQLKWVEAGEYVGYGLSHRCGHRTRLGVLPIGYADGYDRGLSAVAHVLVRKRRAPVIGRICMNITLIDLTDVADAAIEDEVILIGRSANEALGAERLAGWAQTIPYEIVARLTPSLPRLGVDPEGSPA
ncbi:MAG: alanine racemase C-terminal domain-containing protein [Candidatus Eisenbacteria bacterium]